MFTPVANTCIHKIARDTITIIVTITNHVNSATQA